MSPKHTERPLKIMQREIEDDTRLISSLHACIQTHMCIHTPTDSCIHSQTGQEMHLHGDTQPRMQKTLSVKKRGGANNRSRCFSKEEIQMVNKSNSCINYEKRVN